MENMKNHSITVVIPVFNEESNILPLVKELSDCLSKRFDRYEILFVDDSSTDKTLRKIEEARHIDQSLTLIANSENRGQGASLFYGFRRAKYATIACLDGDLQFHSSDIVKLYNLKIAKGVDFVCSYRGGRRDAILTKHIPSVIGNSLIRFLFQTPFRDIGSSLKVARKEDLVLIPLFDNLHRYTCIFLHSFGLRGLEVRVGHRKRFSGSSKYSALKVFSILFELFKLKGFISSLENHQVSIR